MYGLDRLRQAARGAYAPRSETADIRRSSEASVNRRPQDPQRSEWPEHPFRMRRGADDQRESALRRECSGSVLVVQEKPCLVDFLMN